jgi:serine O-acetyltransferase
MAKSNFADKSMEKLVHEIVETYSDDKNINFIDATNLPVKDKILEILERLMELLFPGYTGKNIVTRCNIGYMVGDILCKLYADLTEQVYRALKYRCRMQKCESCDCQTMADDAVKHLLSKLSDIRQKLKGDVEAAFDGDPAASSYEEIVLSYPCVIAIAIYRIAHELYIKDIPLIPRIMSEYAHSRTGIDINAGATIGRNFFIDHGTGVVIGETAVIGDNVKLYQGTTLGALSFAKDERGRIIKGGKRHPMLEDNVTVYAEATILGNVTIGKDSVIGGNVWVKEDVPAGVTVTATSGELVYRKRKDIKSASKE